MPAKEPTGTPSAFSTGPALVFLLGALVLLICNRRIAGRGWRVAACAMAGAVGLAGAAGVLGTLAAGQDATALLPTPAFNWLTYPSDISRMPLSATAFCLLLATALVVAARPPLRLRRLPQYGGALLAALAMVPILGFAYGAHILAGAPPGNKLDAASALCFLLLGVALCLLRPLSGPAAIVLRSGAGGSLSRRLLPVYLMLPVPGLCLYEEQARLASLLLLLTFGLPAGIWALALATEDAESERVRSSERLDSMSRELSKHMRTTVEAQTEAAEAVEARSRFVATVSHELRTPLSGIIGVTELLRDTQLDENQKELLSIIEESSQALSKTISDILDFTEMEAQKIHIELADLDLAHTVNSVIRSFQGKAAARGLDLSLRFGQNVPQKVRGDAARIRQILASIVDNAIKFTERGAVTVDVGLLHQLADQLLVRFAVTDTGIGIESDTAERLFQPFVQADGSFTRRYGGTGLGLSIGKSLVELMGGTLGVESIPGKGSTFWLDVPLLVAGSPTERSGLLPAGQLRNRGLVLVAEDNPVDARLTVMQLRKLGCRAEVATTGGEAVERWHNDRLGLILMDIEMPGGDGFATTRLIRRREMGKGEHVPVVAMTAHAVNGDRDRCLAAGMDDYITKPINLESLKGVLDRWLLDDTNSSAGQIIPFRQRS